MPLGMRELVLLLLAAPSLRKALPSLTQDLCLGYSAVLSWVFRATLCLHEEWLKKKGFGKKAFLVYCPLRKDDQWNCCLAFVVFLFNIVFQQKR